MAIFKQEVISNGYCYKSRDRQKIIKAFVDKYAV